MEFFLDSTPLFLTGVFVLGALIGSFLNVVILRLPRVLEHDWRCQCQELLEIESEEKTSPEGLVFARSECPKCHYRIRFLENIPIFSYLFLRGKCSNCSQSISLRYPFVELVTACVFLICIWHFGPTLQGLTALILSSYLIALTGIDIDHQLLPDNLTIPLMWAGILLSIWGIHTDLLSSVIGTISGYLILWTIYQVFKILTGKEGMGYGDFKLLAALGAWMGWQSITLILILSSVVGAAVGLTLMATGKLQRDRPMPFGPFIAASGWIALIWGSQILEIYLGPGLFG